jgi:hypothetical protein
LSYGSVGAEVIEGGGEAIRGRLLTGGASVGVEGEAERDLAFEVDISRLNSLRNSIDWSRKRDETFRL